MRTFRLFIVSTIIGLALAACGRGDTVTAEQIMDGLKQTREQTRDAHAVAGIEVNGTEQGDGSFVVETWMRKSDKTDAAGKPIAQSRVKVLEASKDELAGTEMVNDGETIWIYNPASNKVITGKIADLKEGRIGEQDPTAQMVRMQEQLQQLLDGSNVEIVADNEPVAGRDAWKVKLTPKPETSEQMQLGSLIETTLWIGHERYVPLKANIDGGDLGKFAAEVRQIELDQGIDASVFTFTPPAGAEIVDAAELAKNARPQNTTIDEAKANASFPVLVPSSLPQGVVLEEVQTLSMGGETVLQNYSGTIEWSLVQTKGGRGEFGGETPFSAKAEPVTVRGQAGTLVTGSGNEQGTLLRWEENGVTIIIAGTLSADQATTIAESLK